MGTDVVDVGRFERSLERTPSLRDRLFTPAESSLAPESLAARFAAKEALAKAFGAVHGLSWHDAEVVVDDRGRPSFELRDGVAQAVTAAGASRVHLSISHDAGVALAFVVLEA